MREYPVVQPRPHGWWEGVCACAVGLAIRSWETPSTAACASVPSWALCCLPLHVHAQIHSAYTVLLAKAVLHLQQCCLTGESADRLALTSLPLNARLQGAAPDH
jgi:hypothetical protein